MTEKLKSEPYENMLSVEQLRREVREAWDLAYMVRDALQSAPEVPPYEVLIFLSGAGQWPEDYNLGKAMQNKLGLAAIAPKTECEIGAGMWSRIRRGLVPDGERVQESEG